MVARLQTNAGLEVFSFKDGLEALERFKKNHKEIGLIITDMIMPDMNGKELSKQLKKILPKTFVLFASGYVDDNVYMNQSGVTVFTPPADDHRRRRVLSRQIKCRNLGL